VSPRSAASPFTITERRPSRRDGHEPRERVLGQIDGVRVWYECHPGAIYLHGGRSYLATGLDEERRRVTVEPTRADWYTVVSGDKETAILERVSSRRVGPFPVGLGRLRVTMRVRGYQRRKLFGGEPLSNHPLAAPPSVYETVGFWIELAPGMPAAFAARELHFMGGIHAAEHALIGLFPLLAIADRGDVGGISYTGHPQLGRPAIFVYDGVPGGAGLAEQGFADLESLVARTLELIRTCACDAGCPACIQSPQCGNGNKPLDRKAARLVLETLAGEVALESLGLEAVADSPLELPAFPVAPVPVDPGRRHGIARAGNVEPAAAAPAVALAVGGRLVFLDVETQRSAEEVGGWSNTPRMGLALAVVYDAARDVWRTYYEADVHRLLFDLVLAERVVGFNIDRFDLPVLSAYTDQDLSRIRTLDMLSRIHAQVGFRLSLNDLSEANLGEAKAGDGMQSLRWWKEGRIDLIERYCRQDVEATRKLYELGSGRGYLLYRDRDERKVRLPVSW
jgi:DEAD/DEAH box helicase domain-containing protein